MVLLVITGLVFVVTLVLGYLVDGFGHAMSDSYVPMSGWEYAFPIVVAAVIATVVYGTGSLLLAIF